MNALEHVAAHIRERASAYCEATGVPGYLAGVYHDGHQAVVAHGIANTATGMEMRDDTGFLFGSITKVMTSTLVLQQVERGAIDLDERVVTYLPEVSLTTPPLSGSRDAGCSADRHLQAAGFLGTCWKYSNWLHPRSSGVRKDTSRGWPVTSGQTRHLERIGCAYAVGRIRHGHTERCPDGARLVARAIWQYHRAVFFRRVAWRHGGSGGRTGVRFCLCGLWQ